MLLAGDLGGTKTLLGLFERAPLRPVPVRVRSLPTGDFTSLGDMVESFLRDSPRGRPRIEAAAFGVAGPVIDDEAQIVNVGWRVDGKAVAIDLGLSRIRLLNDLVAVAHSIAVLEPHELHVVQEGVPNLSGNAALIAAGTGLGQSFLFNDGHKLVPGPSEGGHADFAARTPRELELTAWLTQRFGRAEVEQVISGNGLRNLYDFTHHEPCPVGPDSPADVAALVSTNALAEGCEQCREAFDLFLSAYGAEAGNLALRSLATRGVYIGGGIAPKILGAFSTGAFMRAFTSKAPLSSFLETVPVKVILNPQAGLLGAATVANAEIRG